MIDATTVLECQQLRKTFHEGQLHVEVLREINFSIQAGQRLAIVGSSGSGKSTLLHLLGGLETPTSGTIRIAGQTMQSLSDAARSRLRNRYLGFIYQFHHLLPEFTVLENVCIPLLLQKTTVKVAQEKAKDLLAKVGLSKRLLHKLGELSGGERQRTAIARALVTEPVCVLADEPTGNLDQYTAQQVYELILNLNESIGTSFIIVTHDLKLAQKMQQTFSLENGKLLPTN